MDDFSDLTAQIQCRLIILQFLGGIPTSPLLSQWLSGGETRYQLSYSQYEELSESLKRDCRAAYKTYAKNHAVQGRTTESI